VKLSAAFFFVVATVLGFAASAGAVDGTIEINQAKVMAAGGFPYMIVSAGSYRLTGNLTVSSTASDAIDVTANHVTVDLNGFSITGPAGSGSPSGNGISGPSAGALTVENGTITGFGAGNGVATGNNGIVKNIHSDSNFNGIITGTSSVIEGCTATGNVGATSIGIGGAGGTLISGNTVNSDTNGINCNGSGCLISNNVIQNNTGYGIFTLVSDATTGYGGNVLNNNSLGINGGTSMKNNVCSGALC
jgi:hypothetical protein